MNDDTRHGRARHDGTRDARTRDGIARETLRVAADGPEPDMSRLLAAVPAMMAEARRRRLVEAGTPLAAVVPLASRLIPRLAAATAVLVLLASLTLAIDMRTRGGERSDVDSMLLGSADNGAPGGGSAGAGIEGGAEGGGVDDLLLGRPAAQGDENG